MSSPAPLKSGIRLKPFLEFATQKAIVLVLLLGVVVTAILQPTFLNLNNLIPGMTKT